jgi:hypothetical protein
MVCLLSSVNAIPPRWDSASTFGHTLVFQPYSCDLYALLSHTSFPQGLPHAAGTTPPILASCLCCGAQPSSSPACGGTRRHTATCRLPWHPAPSHTARHPTRRRGTRGRSRWWSTPSRTAWSGTGPVRSVIVRGPGSSRMAKVMPPRRADHPGGHRPAARLRDTVGRASSLRTCAISRIAPAGPNRPLQPSSRSSPVGPHAWPRTGSVVPQKPHAHNPWPRPPHLTTCGAVCTTSPLPAIGVGRRVRRLRPVRSRAGAPVRVHAPLSRIPRS